MAVVTLSRQLGSLGFEIFLLLLFYQFLTTFIFLSFCNGKFADRKPDDFPSLVLLDLKLPKVDGFEVLRVIRKNETLLKY